MGANAGPVFVVNPNSTLTVTEGIDRALDELRHSGAPEIRCLTLAEGPPGIETQAHIDGVVAPLCRLAAELEDEASAFVIACFSDPALAELRVASKRPVFGIAESAYRKAAAGPGRFGILSIVKASVARHRRYLERLGLLGALAGDRPVEMAVEALAEDPAASLAGLTEVGMAIVEKDGADALVLGCTSMAPFKDDLSSALGVPVIEPSQAAVAEAIAALVQGHLAKDSAAVLPEENLSRF